MGRKWRLVSFVAESGTKGYANKRAEMWAKTKEWLQDGGVLPDGDIIHDDLIGPEAYVNDKGQIVLESKKHMKDRGLPSPNEADALALTFAYPVQRKKAGRDAVKTDYKLFKRR